MRPLSGHEDCSLNELLRATQFLRSTVLLGSLNPKTSSLNGNMHDTFEHASSSLQMHGTWHCTESQCQSVLWSGGTSSTVQQKYRGTTGTPRDATKTKK